MLIKNFEKRYQDSVLWVRIDFFCFWLLRGTKSTNTDFFFWLNTPNGTVKDPTVDFLRLNTLRGTKTA